MVLLLKLILIALDFNRTVISPVVSFQNNIVVASESMFGYGLCSKLYNTTQTPLSDLHHNRFPSPLFQILNSAFGFGNYRINPMEVLEGSS